MTIAGRNKILIFGICVAALLVIGVISCSVIITAHHILAEFPAAPKSHFWLFRLPLFTYNNYAAMVGFAVCPLMAFALLIYVFFLFEKTYAIEASFFSLFIFALSFESLQLLFPLQKQYPLLAIFLAPAARAILFFRFSACLSLLTSSLFAHKIFTRETGSVIFLLCFLSFALSHTIPINTARTLSFFLFSDTYIYLLYSFNGIVYALAILSFLFVGIFRNIPEYQKASLWLFLILLAYIAILYTGAWFFIIIGIVIFLIASFFFLGAIHQFYLWQ